MKIKRGDVVKVITGDDRGKTGKVLEVDLDTRKVLIEGLNMVWEHVRRSQRHPKGGRIKREAMLDATNVLVVCQSCAKPTRVKFGWTEDPQIKKSSRRKSRLCRKCGKAVNPEE